MIQLRELKVFPNLGEVKNPPLPTEEWFYRPCLSDWQTVMILDLLERIDPLRCFEFGSGFSTLFFPRFIKQSKWIAIEHQEYFYPTIEKLAPSNVTVINRPIFDGYVESILDQSKSGPFDFVFIDGERRSDCIEIAHEAMRPGAVIVRHDAGTLDEPIITPIGDARRHYSKHGIMAGLWWAVK